MAEAAPLIDTPAAPIPPGGAAEWFTGAGEARLRAALFSPGATSRGSVVLSPGRTEPIEKYFEVVGELVARGFTVLVHDWRGHGFSHRMLPDRLLGHAVGCKDFLADFAALLAAFDSRLPKPWIAMGHSMGGCLTLLVLATGEDRFAAAVLSAPMLGLKTGAIPKPVARFLAALMSAIGYGGRAARPESADPAPFEMNVLTHDRARYDRNNAQVAACPDLALGPPTWGWLDFAFSAVAVLAKGDATARIGCPLTVLAAEDERLVDNDDARRTTVRVPGSKFIEVPGAFHEILQETDERRAVFWQAFDALTARCAPGN